MGLGSFLTTRENLEIVKKNSWKFGRPLIVEMGLGYYDSHPEEVAQVARNLDYMGLPSSGDALDRVLRG